MSISYIHLGGKINTQYRLQSSENIPCLAQWEKKDGLHELVVPANALWDVGFCDTDCL